MECPKVSGWRLVILYALVIQRFTFHSQAARTPSDQRHIFLKGEPIWMPSPRDDPPKHIPTLIPRIIHRMDKSTTPNFNAHEESWRRLNPGWTIKVWNDDSGLEFVRQAFPEYLDAYQRLSRNIERSDFFRYMVVLRMGGMYVDSDVECRKPLEAFLHPADAMVAGWEADFPNATYACNRTYARKRQALQWAFAAVPGHPALRDVCDHISRNVVTRFSEDAQLSILERRWPTWHFSMGAEFAWFNRDLAEPLTSQYAAAERGDPWTVRVLPIVQMGILVFSSGSFIDGVPLGALEGMSSGEDDDWTPGYPEAVLVHHFAGSWKNGDQKPEAALQAAVQGPVPQEGPLYRPGVLPDGNGGLVKAEEDLPFDRSDMQLYPVSIPRQPPFSMLLNLRGQGDLQAGSDMSAMLTKFGEWQPSLRHDRVPTVTDALIGGLESIATPHRVLVDVGAGNGYFSLAAAARGHRAVAFEMSNRSVASFEASIAYNGFEKSIALHKIALGAESEDICIAIQGEEATLETRRGYGSPMVHDMAQARRCQHKARRTKGARLILRNANVGAVRIAASGWEGWVVDGLQKVWTTKDRVPPTVMLIELYPEAMQRHGYPGGASALLRKLHSAGYSDIVHSGPRCDARQLAMHHRQQHTPLAEEVKAELFTWCSLEPAQFSEVLDISLIEQPENVLLTHKLREREWPKINPHRSLRETQPSTLVNFWTPYARAMIEGEPLAQLPKDWQPVEPDLFSHINKDTPRPNVINLSPKNVSALQHAHAQFITKLLPGGGIMPAPYKANSQGIVTSAAGDFLPVLVVSLRLLRRYGSKLPVEVFLETTATAEVDSEICQNVLPKLDAKCVPMGPIIATSHLPKQIGHYQIKAFALLFSHFEDILWIDADNIAISPPEALFDSEVFCEKGLVTWPDYWHNTASPAFYKISATWSEPKLLERAASESGQVLVSKKRHGTTLMLVGYYNYYGPTHFYPLLSQGAIGQGDKETFLAAAMALDAPFYSVQGGVGTLGYFRPDGSFHGTAVLQHHPNDDYELHQKHHTPITPDKRFRQMFVHCQTIKADAAKMPTTYLESVKGRMWDSAESIIQKFGTDLEKDLWDEVLYTACELEWQFDAWNKSSGICDTATLVYRALFEGESWDLRSRTRRRRQASSRQPA